jgi:ribosome-associated translation inhibitor RaiA
MQRTDERRQLRIQLDTKNCDVSPGEIAKMENALEHLGRVARTFPVSDLYIYIHRHARTNDYHVKTSLVLSGKTLFTGDRDLVMYAAYERCLRKLVQKVEAYKRDLDNTAEVAKQEKGTHHELHPSRAPDPAVLEEAVRAADYAAFRQATLAYEDGVRQRVGRWAQRYPKLEAQIGKQLQVDDLIEEVFLNAFERYERRPAGESLSEWLEKLIDPSVKALLDHGDEERENISFARTLTDTAVSPK